ncbi:MAG: signal peptide peptidase SppA [Pirellulaceae bacterium]|nr:signal peptide peptidase SppA [Pirellulaceae bacterium]
MSERPTASKQESPGLDDSGKVQIPGEIVVRHRQVGRTLAWQSLAVVGWVSVLLLYGILEYHWYISRDFYDDSKGIREYFVSGQREAKNKIAIIKITGVIYDGAGYVQDQIEKVAADTNVKAVVLRVNSPGGTVSGSDYIYHHLQKMLAERNIPVVVSMGSVAASGGYYVSMVVGDQKDSIFAEPTCTTGSIGVIIPHWNYSDLMATYGVTDDSIMSHPRKRMLSPSRKMPEDHRILLQQYVDESFERFKEVVLAGRPQLRSDDVDGVLPNERIPLKVAFQGRDVATGEIFHAPTALGYGLIDRLGFLEDAVERATELAGLKEDNLKVVEYSRPAPWIELPYLSKVESKNPMWSLLMELNSPRAYYLSSSFPPLMSSWDDPAKTRVEQAD